MAEHKVPQDVEADDKLIGPFSFRQFVYLMIAAGAGFLAFLLGQIAVPLAFIPSPICLFFLVIALPLRKDQPTEIYLAALVKYIFKPHVRMWQADGEKPLIEISNPVVDDTPKVKDLAGDEVSRRLSFLANLSDTQGWSTRGVTMPNNTNLTDEFAADAVNAQDMLEDGGALSSSIEHMLDKSEQQVRQNAINQMNIAAIQANQRRAEPVSLMPNYSVQQSGSTVAAPNLTNSANLPTYSYDSTIQSSAYPPNLQTRTPQPMHNNRLRSFSGREQLISTQPVAVPAATSITGSTSTPVPRQQVSTASPSTQPQPALVKVNAQQNPVPAMPVIPATQSVPVARNRVEMVAPSQPMPAPTVSKPIKPVIMDNDNASHQPKIDDTTDDGSMIDIKLH